ncbi:MAG: DUF4242 domain-containing protein [Thermomicrobium sp.]|nr:DUF4242 domain-containing protein [Thermomicrobium sp.]
MPLFLAEYRVEATDRAQLEPLFRAIDEATRAAGGEVVEFQVGQDLALLYAVLEHGDGAALRAVLERAGLAPHDFAQVRLVGQSLDEVKAQRGAANYLVEWDLPAGLTMEAYLARKAEKSPLYAQVPEVRFLRTYVREDMAKCVCLYAAPDEDAVRRARQVVSAPVDRLTRLCS